MSKLEEKLKNYLDENQEKTNERGERETYTVYTIDHRVQGRWIREEPSIREITVTKGAGRGDDPTNVEDAKKEAIEALEKQIKNIKKLKEKDITKR